MSKKSGKSGKNPKQRVERDILLRVNILYAIFISLALIITVRLIWIQISPEVAHNTKKLEHKVFKHHTVLAHRGSILADNGAPLATSIFKYQVEMDYSSEGFDSLELFEFHVDSLSKLLALHFKDKSAAQYKKAMLSERAARYKLTNRRDSIIYPQGWWARVKSAIRGDELKSVIIYDTLRDKRLIPLLPRYVDYAEWQELQSYPILNWNMGMCYNLASRDERIYPQGELARRTIGKLLGDRGQDYGIEGAYSQYLAGSDGYILRQRIARGFYGEVDDPDNIDPVDGMDIITTIDVALQDYADRALREQLTRHNALWGTTVVMDVVTGDIVAMVNLGRGSSGGYIEDRNYAIGSRMEPGSTFKLATTIALLDDAKMSPDKEYDSGNGDYISVGNMKIRDSHKGHTTVSLKEAFANSLNGYFATATYEHYDGDEVRFTNFLSTLHLDKTVGLEEFGAVAPILLKPGDSNWRYDYTLPYLACGYNVELTPLHTLTLYNAVANDGKMVAPRLIKEIRKDGNTVEKFPVKVLNPQICSKSTLRSVQEYMGEVASTGTANQYFSKFENFNVAAKTGTAQVAQSGTSYRDGYYLGSMACYFPTDRPRYSIITAIYTRLGNSYSIYGSTLTGEVQRRIIQYLYNRESDWYNRVSEQDDISPYPSKVKGGNIEQLSTIANKLNRGIDKERNTEWGGSRVDSTGRVVVNDITLQAGVMPNLIGMSLKDAIFVAESCGVRVTFSGEGAVYGQSVKAGTKVSSGARVNLRLR